MKNFFRTIAGKTILFVLCIVSFCTLAGSVIGAIFMVEHDFYTSTEQNVYNGAIDRNIRNLGYSVIWDMAHPDMQPLESEYDSVIIYEVLNQYNYVIRRSENSQNTSDWSHTHTYGIFTDNDNQITDISFIFDDDYEDINEYYTVNMKLKENLPESSYYSITAKLIHIAYDMKYIIFVVGIVSLIATIICFISLMCVSARKPGSDELCPGLLNKVPFDILLASTLTFGLILFNILAICIDYAEGIFYVIIALCMGLLLLIFFLALCMSISARIKQNTLTKNTIIFKSIRKTFRVVKKACNNIILIFKNIPFIWRTALIMGGITLFEFLGILLCWYESDNLMILWFIEKILIIPAVLYVAINLRNLQKGGIALANGDLSFHTDTKGMFWDFKKHGDNLNSIAEGMTIAVEDRLKSERTKTELITNVSHDIKTPLTSIINYATLIGNETCENENITEYSEVLVRQSERLKRLIEDLVEASKASSGNLDVNLAPCDASVFVTQASGEYEEKLNTAGLTLITKQPGIPVQIMADGRRMWRIFDNLMNNIYKYAQNGTRVYLSLETEGNNAIITFKNISRDSMDISENELMERFVRGDSSRNTEGNGLGLSIAKSMAELQNGLLNITVDGDLFKAILTFPIIQ